MADKTTRLTAPNGATVTVLSDRTDELLRRGFTSGESKAPAKKAASSSKSSK